MFRILTLGFACLLALVGGESTVKAQNKAPNGVVKKKAKPSEIKSKLPAAFNSVPNVNLPVKPVKAEQIAKVRESAAKIDQFINAKLASEGIDPNSEIDDARFVRRAYLDITGQIPTGR